MNQKYTFGIIGILIIVLSVSGCLKYTQETEFGTITHDFIANTTIGHVDCYTDNGQHVTGRIFMDHGANTVYYNLYKAEINGYYGAIKQGYEHDGVEWVIIK